jgi:hypothetical protein
MTEFDTVKGAFFLVSVVIGTMMLVVIVSISSCAYLSISGGSAGVCSGLQDFAKELITMSFTAAIAFAGGRMSATPVVPPPKLPNKEEIKGE